MNVKSLIEYLKSVDLSKTSYDEIFSRINDSEIKLPYLTTLIKKGQPIWRGRLNKTTQNNSLFKSEKEISYRTDLSNIKTFGRANKINESMFYGVAYQNSLTNPEMVLLSELTQELIEGLEMIIGLWIAKQDFEVIDICYSEIYNHISAINNKKKFWEERLKNTIFDNEDSKNLLSFFSDEFAKKVKPNNDYEYKLSCAYTDIAIHLLPQKGFDIKGILFPSVKFKYEEYNIALTPEAVDKYLELNKVVCFKGGFQNNFYTFKPFYDVSDFGIQNSDFKWIKSE